MPDILQFLWELSRRWLTVGGAILTVIGFFKWEYRAGKFTAALGVIVLVVSFFGVWDDIHLKSEANGKAAERLAELEHAGIAILVKQATAPRKDPHFPPRTDDGRPGTPPHKTAGVTEVSQPLPEPIVGKGLTLTATRTASARSQFPYAITITVSVDRLTQPFGILFECDRAVADAEFLVRHQDVYTSALQGAVKGDPKSYYIGFASPAVTPEEPVVVTLFSKGPVSLLRANRLYLEPDAASPR